MFLPEKSILCVIDIQGNLAARMPEKETLFRHIQSLIQVSRYLEVPVVWTEQAPQKIGETVPEIKSLLKDLKPIQKYAFSCCGQPEFLKHIEESGRDQLILCGIETHVCIYQTASDLIERGYSVQVVADAVASRTAENKTIALERVRDLGGIITSTEMIAMELVKTAKHKSFRDMIALIK